MGTMVKTVTGALPLAQLGYCQMHEHLYVSLGPATQENPALLIDRIDKSSLEAARYFAAGGRSLLDAQPGGAGRDARALRAISLASDVAILCVTGFHLPMFYPAGHPIDTMDEGALYALFLSELLEGVSEDKAICAGAVKAALTSDGFSGRTKDKLRAAARAAKTADVPLVVHTERGAGALQAIDACMRLGLPPSRILICHADRQAADFAPHEAIARTGALLEYDTIGRFKYHSDEDEVRLIVHMLEKGFEAQLLLSLDTTAARLTSYGGAIGLDYLLTSFLPRLRAQNIPESVLQTITLVNPTRAFA
ncbi:MAG: phosphotriesterase [Clostridia bacterium]